MLRVPGGGVGSTDAGLDCMDPSDRASGAATGTSPLGFGRLVVGALLLPLLLTQVSGVSGVSGPRLDAAEQAPLAEAIIDRYAAMPLPEWTPDTAKVHGPRVALAKLTRGVDVAAVNAWLGDAHPWSDNGSTWFGHEGDYDFTLVTLTRILHRFADRPERLYPATRRHLLETLLTARGGEPRRTVPRTHGLVIETENHVLMTEGSRYLRAQFLAADGRADAARSQQQLADFLAGDLQRRIDRGFTEFNSIPYAGYTAQALLNLADFAADAEVRDRAVTLLDREAMRYARSSLNFRRCVPFHRKAEYRGLNGLREGPWTSLMMTWCGVDADGNAFTWNDVPRRHMAVNAALADYRPPPEAVALASRKTETGTASWTHAAHLCPTTERHAYGPGHLISAATPGPDLLGKTVARPAVVLLRDGVRRVDRCIRVVDPSPLHKRDAVVQPRLLVATGRLHMPRRFPLAHRADPWRLYKLHAGDASEPGPAWAAAYQGEGFALVTLLDAAAVNDPSRFLQALAAANPNPHTLRQRFVLPGGETARYPAVGPRMSQ